MEAKWSTCLIKTVNCSLKILIIKIIKMILTMNVTVVIMIIIIIVMIIIIIIISPRDQEILG